MLYHRQSIIKWCMYGLLLWFVCAIQISLPLRVSDVHAVPIIAMAVVAAVLEGPRGGAVYGFFAGLLCDAFTAGADGFFAIYMLIAGYVVGAVVRRYFRVSLMTALIWAFAAHAVADLLYFLFFMLIPGRAGPSALAQVALPELLLTLPYVPFIYLISRGIHRRLTEKY